MVAICELTRDFRFEAARSLPMLDSEHPCSRVHGHSFVARMVLRGEVDSRIGWVMDYGEIDKVAGPHIGLLDHAYLNDIAGLKNPTSENIAIWLWERLKSELPLLQKIGISETQTSWVYFSDE